MSAQEKSNNNRKAVQSISSVPRILSIDRPDRHNGEADEDRRHRRQRTDRHEAGELASQARPRGRRRSPGRVSTPSPARVLPRRWPAPMSWSTWPTRPRSRTRTCWSSSDLRPPPSGRGISRRRRAPRCAVHRRRRSPSGQRLPAREGGAGDADQGAGIPYTICAPPSSSSSSPASSRPATTGNGSRLSPALMQPVAARRCRGRAGRPAPSHRRTARSKSAGPEQMPLDELARRRGRQRRPAPGRCGRARAYFGAELDDRSLTPGAHPRLGTTHFQDWLERASMRP